MSSVLEVLCETRRSLSGKPFNFTSWASCACGHIYGATGGERPFTKGVLHPSGMYEQALRTIIKAVESRRWSRTTRPHQTVSDIVAESATKKQISAHKAAQEIINETIVYVEAQQIAAMRRVADPTHHEFALSGD